MAKKNSKAYFVSLVTAICFVCYSSILPSYAYADDTQPEVTTLQKGECAPFAGTLFSVPAAAKLLSDLKFTQEACNIQKQKELSLLRSELQLKVDLRVAEINSLKLRHTDLLKIKNDQIDFLTQQIKPAPWYESGEFWFAIGIVGGILITVGAGYALGQASK